MFPIIPYTILLLLLNNINLVYKIKKAKTEKSSAVDRLKMAYILIEKGFSNLYIAADMWIHCTPITLIPRIKVP